MDDIIICLDTGVPIKYLTTEEPADLSEAAYQLMHSSLSSGRLVAPAFARAEVGSVLRRKNRQRELTSDEVAGLWASYRDMRIDFIDNPALRARTWEIAEQFKLPKLYDAAFLTCTEVALASVAAVREFWTTDLALVRSLGSNRPAYVRVLGVDA